MALVEVQKRQTRFPLLINSPLSNLSRVDNRFSLGCLIGEAALEAYIFSYMTKKSKTNFVG